MKTTRPHLLKNTNAVKTPADKKTAKLYLCLTSAQKKAYEQAAAYAGKNTSAWATDLLDKAAQ